MATVAALYLLGLTTAAALVACGTGDVQLGENLPAAQADAAAFGADGGDARTATSSCAGSRSSVPLPAVGDCTGDLAKRTFRFAVCACTNINFAGNLVTDARSSATGTASATAASVGVDGTYSGASSATSIGGSLWTNGDTSMSGHDVSGDLQCGGNLVADGTSRVHTDAYVQGGVQGALTVDGVLHIPAGQPHVGVSAAGGTTVQPVAVAAPCDCSNPLDVRAIVAGFKQANDDAAIGLDPASLASVDTDRTVTLPCGRYYLTSIGGGAPLTVRVTGRAAIAVEASVIHNLTAVTFSVDPGAELDLFVGGDVLFSGPAQIGNKARAAATRLYVGGVFGYDGQLQLAANLYLPNGAFTTTHW